MYTIGQVSEMFNLPVSTLRYYDKEGLFPFMQRSSGIRQFSDNEIAALKLIECLKNQVLRSATSSSLWNGVGKAAGLTNSENSFLRDRRRLLRKRWRRCRKLLICLLSNVSITSRQSKTAMRTEYIQCFQTSSPLIFRLPTTTHTNNYYLLIIFNTKYGG